MRFSKLLPHKYELLVAGLHKLISYFEKSISFTFGQIAPVTSADACFIFLERDISHQSYKELGLFLLLLLVSVLCILFKLYIKFYFNMPCFNGKDTLLFWTQTSHQSDQCMNSYLFCKKYFISLLSKRYISK